MLSLDPRDVRAENNLGLIYETDGQPAAAIEAYRQAVAWQEQNPHPSEQPYVNLGNLLMEQGQLTEALPPLEKAVALAPNNAFCHLTLGVAYRQSGKLEAAQRELEARLVWSRTILPLIINWADSTKINTRWIGLKLNSKKLRI